MASKYFGPFLIINRVGSIAYTLQLPQRLRIHPTFHVSQLKKHVGHQSVQPFLPLVGSDGTLPKETIRILDRRMVRCLNQAVTEVQVEWTNTFPEDATWEVLQQLQQ